MLCSRKLLLFTGCAVFACALPVLRAAETKEKEKGKKAKPAAEAKPAKKGEKPAKSEVAKGGAGDKPLPKLSIPLPQGQDSKGVVIPYTDASGKKSMLFKIGIGTRIDENHVKMADLQIDTFNEVGEPEMTIDLPSSLLDMNTRVITGDKGVIIKRSDFQITGKKMEFNTESKQGRIQGDVKMVIYDLTDGTTESAQPKKEQPGS